MTLKGVILCNFPKKLHLFGVTMARHPLFGVTFSNYTVGGVTTLHLFVLGVPPDYVTENYYRLSVLILQVIFTGKLVNIRITD